MRRLLHPLAFLTLVVSLANVASLTAEDVTIEPAKTGSSDRVFLQALNNPSADTIVLADGLYLFQEPLRLTVEHSGRRFQAAEGARPVFSGGLRITGWQREQRDGNLWRANVPGDFDIRHLYSPTSGRLPRSRAPEEGWFRGDQRSTIAQDANAPVAKPGVRVTETRNQQADPPSETPKSEKKKKKNRNKNKNKKNKKRNKKKKEESDPKMTPPAETAPSGSPPASSPEPETEPIDDGPTAEQIDQWRVTKPWLFTSLRFRPEDDALFRKIPVKGRGAVVQTIGTDSSAWQPLYQVNRGTRDIDTYTPSRDPLGLTHADVGMPFAIENLRGNIDRNGEWAFDPDRRKLYLQLDGDPNKAVILAGVHETIVDIDGANGVTFEGITFAHSTDGYGHYEQHPTWPMPMREHARGFPERHPPGIATAPTAPHTGNAVRVRNARDASFQNCTFEEVGGYALMLGRGSSHATISACRFRVLGAGGIEIDPEADLKRRPIRGEDDYPSGHSVVDCQIGPGGLTHPAACGIRIVDASDCVIEHNDVSGFAYTGIAIFSNATSSESTHAHQIAVRRNDIYETMRVLSGGAGISVRGPVTSLAIEQNHIHDILRPGTAYGPSNAGVLFGVGSRGTIVRENVIRAVEANARSGRGASNHNDDGPRDFRFAESSQTDHVFMDNDTSVDNTPVRRTSVVQQAGPRK